DRSLEARKIDFRGNLVEVRLHSEKSLRVTKINFYPKKEKLSRSAWRRKLATRGNYIRGRL
ncbi:MAG TPA: hypothetical protein VFN58_00165, partial [Candidatus Binatia bacterium]|nr:hypothetical protein [Candidatus Binatia bacterium]